MEHNTPWFHQFCDFDVQITYLTVTSLAHLTKLVTELIDR